MPPRQQARGPASGAQTERARRRDENLLRDFAERHGVKDGGVGDGPGGGRVRPGIDPQMERVQPGAPDHRWPENEAGQLHAHHTRAGLSSADELVNEEWFTNTRRRPAKSVTRRVLSRAIFALGLMMFAGAVSLVVFEPNEDAPGAEVLVSGLAADVRAGAPADAGDEAPTTAPGAAVAAAPPDAPRQGALTASERAPGAEASAGPVAPSRGAAPAQSGGGVTVLRPRLDQPGITGSVAALPAPARAEAALSDPAAPAAVNPPATAGQPAQSAQAQSAQAQPVPAPAVMFAPRQRVENETLSRLLAMARSANPGAGTENRDEPAGTSGQVASVSTARATTYVNMRAGPDNDEPVVAVVPAEAELEVVECTNWCEVVFDGHRGWIYSKFVERSFAPRGSDNG
ncbi:MAG: SH3 domain-containing protein [Rhizobiales bacterium]|nr:SH3 domain-containing protein [Hyphomicrobiales bacterium]